MRPILFHLGSFPVYSFGVMMVIAFFSAIWLLQRRAPQYGLTKTDVGDLSFWALIAGVLGARIVFIAQEWGYYSTHASELLSLQFRGLTSFGGLLFGMVAVVLWAVKKRMSVRRLLDLSAPAFVLGHIVGRIGCLLNGCCFGGACPSGLPWGIHVDGALGLHHPAQAYDALMNLAALGLILAWERRDLRLGQLVGATLALHGATRFIYEFWRAGTDAQVASGAASSTYWGSLPITQAQGMAAVLVVGGVAAYLIYGRRAERSRLAEATPAPTKGIMDAKPTETFAS